MPNHTSTILEITGDEPEVQRFLDTCIVEEQTRDYAAEKGVMQTIEAFDFNTIIPMPKSLNITSGSTISDAIALFKAEAGDFTSVDAISEYTWVKEKFDKEDIKMSKRDFVIKHLKDTLSDEALKEGQIALDNLEKYGHKDWYDWKVSEWGTKWGAYDYTQIDRGDGMVRIDYQTAWSPATPIISKLGEMFPKLTFVNSYMDEGWGYYGQHTVSGEGELDDDCTFECKGQDFINFVNKNFGYDYQMCPECNNAFNPDCEENDLGVCYSCAEVIEEAKEKTK
jgi:hypothetical protein